ncbi:GMP synthase [Neisseria shayeganii 871]|uniref:GMP synthase n=1 Tax=Neisseria shayeganii 871 TaxID=1032488 RepID=G4CL27_9NEIS|nr:GMP synthase [Neisseria shayeganii 871]
MGTSEMGKPVVGMQAVGAAKRAECLARRGGCGAENQDASSLTDMMRPLQNPRMWMQFKA